MGIHGNRTDQNGYTRKQDGSDQNMMKQDGSELGFNIAGRIKLGYKEPVDGSQLGYNETGREELNKINFYSPTEFPDRFD